MKMTPAARAFTVTTTAQKIVDARAPYERSSVIIAVATDAAVGIFFAIGVAGVTASTGIYVAPGGTITLTNNEQDQSASQEVWAITASSTAAITINES
jgi:hypothetical protein